MERKLVMTFKDIKDKKFNFIVNSIKESLDVAEIKAIMDEVVKTKVLQSKNGALKEKLYAVIVDTSETPFNVL